MQNATLFEEGYLYKIDTIARKIGLQPGTVRKKLNDLKIEPARSTGVKVYWGRSLEPLMVEDPQRVLLTLENRRQNAMRATARAKEKRAQERTRQTQTAARVLALA